MKRFQWVALSVLTLGLASCSTQYHARSCFTNGYSEIQTGDDSFIVSFVGNGFTFTETTVRYALLRAAELSLLHGYPYFAVLSNIDKTQSHLSGGMVGNSPYLTTSVHPATSISIKCYKEKPAQVEVIDANYFMESNRNFN